MKSEPKDSFFQPEWSGSREFNWQRGSVPIRQEEGENAARITEKGPEGTKWRDFSKEVVQDDVPKLVVRRGTRGFRPQGKEKAKVQRSQD